MQQHAWMLSFVGVARLFGILFVDRFTANFPNAETEAHTRAVIAQLTRDSRQRREASFIGEWVEGFKRDVNGRRASECEDIFMSRCLILHLSTRGRYVPRAPLTYVLNRGRNLGAKLPRCAMKSRSVGE